MPILRYFIFVGGALLALIVVVGQTLSQPTVTQASGPALATSNDQPVIRIRSDRKLPERVVLDTSQIAPAVRTAAVAAETAPSPVLAEMSAKSRVRDTFAQFTPEPKSATSSAKVAEVATAEAKPVDIKPVATRHAKRKVARTHAQPQYYGQSFGPQYYNGGPQYGRPMRVAQQPHFGMFGNTW
jgi:hypothetical protein